LQSVPGSVKPLGEGETAKGMPERTTRLHQKRAMELPLEEVPEAYGKLQVAVWKRFLWKAFQWLGMLSETHC
jgi:hypothetical protein